MGTILKKAQTLISTDLGAMLDRALHADSLAVLDAYIRQARDSVGGLEDAVVTMGGQVQTLKRKADEFEGKAEELDGNVDALLQRGKEDLAIAAQFRLNNAREMAQEYREQYRQQQQEYKRFLDARLKLAARVTEVRQEREQLQALLELTRAKEVAPRVSCSLDDLARLEDSDVARIASGIRQRVDKAPEKADAGDSRLGEQMNRLLEMDEIQTQLEARRIRLGI